MMDCFLTGAQFLKTSHLSMAYLDIYRPFSQQILENLFQSLYLKVNRCIAHTILGGIYHISTRELWGWLPETLLAGMIGVL